MPKFVFTHHAYKRLKERYPEIYGPQVHNVLEIARKPTAEQTAKLQNRVVKGDGTHPLIGVDNHEEIVFIVRDSEDVIVTLYPLNDRDERPKLAAKPRLFRLKPRRGGKPDPTYAKRRQKEQIRPWQEIE